jgi:hypothetical protein
MRRLRLALGLVMLGTDKPHGGLPGYGEDNGNGRCPYHPEFHLVEEDYGYFCELCDDYIDDEDRLLP